MLLRHRNANFDDVSSISVHLLTFGEPRTELPNWTIEVYKVDLYCSQSLSDVVRTRFD